MTNSPALLSFLPRRLSRKQWFLIAADTTFQRKAITLTRSPGITWWVLMKTDRKPIIKIK